MALTKGRYRMIEGSEVNVTDFGAKLDGVTNDTAAWQSALNTGKNVYFPEGTSIITNKIVISPSVQGTVLRGAGRNKSFFKISYTSFNMGADAVLQMGSHYQRVQGITMTFDQPSTSVRANLKQYPVAIDINGMIRSELSHIRVESAYVGIRAQGNCGGAVWDDIQMSALFQGIVIDGALDTVRINRFHFWPFGFTADTNGLMLILRDALTTCIDVGRCDDLVINSMLSFQARLIFTEHTAGQWGYGTISNLTLDTGFARIEVSAGKYVFSGVSYSTRETGDFFISQTGGELQIDGFFGGTPNPSTPYPLINISGATTRFIGTNFQLLQIHQVTPTILRVSGNAQATLCHGYFKTSPNTNITSPLIDIASGRATIMGVRVEDKGTGTGTFVRIASDDFHVCMGNSAPGWSYSFPGTQASGIYGPNK